jgi:hypothetical protein
MGRGMKLGIWNRVKISSGMLRGGPANMNQRKSGLNRFIEKRVAAIKEIR